MNRAPLLGDRVRVSNHCSWAKGAMATIMGGIEGDAMRFRRVVSCSDGVRTYYFLVFDQPQVDERGEGPYIGAEIESSYVELLKSAERTPAPSEGQVAE